jgi:hypothetical protein
MKFTPKPSFIFQNGKNQIYNNWGKPIIMSKNEKYFLNSLRFAPCHTALSSRWSSGRITRDIWFTSLHSFTQIFVILRSAKTSYILDVIWNSEFPPLKENFIWIQIYFKQYYKSIKYKNKWNFLLSEWKRL